MVNNYLFSVIIGLYNSQKFFSKGLRYLLSQTFKDFEIILVDDGSTDSTPRLCDEAAESYPNVRVIHQENLGLGGARNTGIETASGEYLCFFDIDDKVEDEWLSNIFQEIKETKPDLLIYGYREINIKYKSENIFRFERKLLKEKSVFVREFVENLSGIRFNNGFTWNKVYKRDFILRNELRFPDNRIQQDEIFNHRVYRKHPVILISDQILYNYYVYDKGINRKRFIPGRLGIFENVKKSFIEIKNHFEINDKNLDEYIHHRFLSNVLFNRNTMKGYKERRDFLMEVLSNTEVGNSAGFIKMNKLKGKGVHGFFFNLYCKGIRKRSLPLLVIADYLYSGLKKTADLIRK